MIDFSKPEEREAFYREHAALLWEIVDGRRRHEAEVPNCGSRPLCCGPMQTISIGMMAQDDRLMAGLMMVAAGELSRSRDQVAELERRLEVQRDLTTDALKNLEAMERRATVAEESEQALAGALDDERNAHAKTLAELTNWQEAAEVLAPTTPTE